MIITIKTTILNLVCSCLLIGCINSKPNNGIQNEETTLFTGEIDHKNLDQKIKLLMSEKSIPGLNILIVEDQEIILQKSYGVSDLDENTPMDNGTSVRLASASKVLTGLLVMSLAEDKVIDLDQSFGNYFSDSPSIWKEIPLWRMLNHTSGIPKFLNVQEFDELPHLEKAKFSHRKAFDVLSQMPLDYQPGSNWRYQQSAYSMLAMMLIELTGNTWDELLNEHVFHPAGMHATQFGDSLGIHPVSYVKEADKLIKSEYYYPRAFSMGGGYNSTSNDLVKLFKSLNANHVVNSRLLMKESTKEERLYDLKSEYYAPATIVKQFGLTQSLGHSGGGGLADIRYFPEQKIGMAVFTNYSGSGAAIELTEFISAQLFGEKVTR